MFLCFQGTATGYSYHISLVSTKVFQSLTGRINILNWLYFIKKKENADSGNRL